MDVVSFYQSILPPLGYRALAVFKNGLKNAPTHIFFDSDADMIAAAIAYDSQGKNVYHACSVYKTDANRKGDNAAAAKSLWIDADVGPTKPYATAKDAAAAIEAFRITVGLEVPHMVKSGGGIHAYFPFTKSIGIEQWQRLAEAFAACMDHAGVKHDSSRTQDCASILRIPDTHNYKTDPAKVVRVLRSGVEEPVSSIYKKLKAYAEVNGVLLMGAKPKGKVRVTNDLIGEQTYPPSEGSVVATHCAVLAEVESTGGDVSYDIWWRAMGVAKHTTEPEAVAIHWTRSREATGHDKADAQGTIDSWAAGPTTCAEFGKHSSHCSTCAHNGKIKSPVQLGTAAQPVVQPLPPPVPVPPPARPWTFGAQWIMDEIAKRTRTGFSNGQMTMSVQSEDGTYKHVPFCDRYWQVMQRVRTLDDIWQLEIGYTTYGGKTHKTFLLDSAAVTAPDLLRKAFSARELHIYGGTKGMQRTQDMLREEQDMLFGTQSEMITFPSLGWASVDNEPRGALTGDFVIGDQLISPRLPPRQILLDEGVAASIKNAFHTAGTTAQWVSQIDHIYNRPGAEAYQFIICAMFAAPLVRLVPGGGSWHGIPIALTGDSGAAKTTTAQVALSIYAKPERLQWNGNMQKDGQGDTINAFAAKIGMLQNLPFCADEMTNIEPEKLSSIMYMIPMGQGKDRLNSQSRMIPNTHRWDTISITTGNEVFHEKLKMLANQHTQEATQLRCFQIKLSAEDLTTVFPDITKSMIDHDLLGSQYGCVGMDWLQLLVNRRIKVSDYLGLKRRSYKIDANDSTAIRFYKDLLMTTEVAAELAKKFGFIHFDIPAMMAWARKQLILLRDAIAEKNWEGTISDFIGSLHGRTIVTKFMKIGPGRRVANEAPLEPLSSHTPPVARKALDDRIFAITTNSLRDWCKEQRIQTSSMVNEMVERGYIVIRGGGKVEPSLINIAGGTNVSRARAPCWELNFDRIAHHSHGSDEASLTNVVQLPGTVVTNSVTNQPEQPPDTAVSP